MMIRTILLLVLAASAAPGVAAETTAAFEPAPCKFEGVKASWAKKNRVECGWLNVRESRDKPDSRKLKLWVAIARADGADRREDPILYIQGGPGVATVDYFFPYFPKSKTWPGFRKARDMVFFDQRGTGRSQPAFCPELNATLAQVQQEAPPAREALDRSKAAYAACRPKMLAQGMDFTAFNSTVTVETCGARSASPDGTCTAFRMAAWSGWNTCAAIPRACAARSWIRCSRPTHRSGPNRSA